jgi:preprotein translocase subunit YajC
MEAALKILVLVIVVMLMWMVFVILRDARRRSR